jgi:hypothetical protein
MATPSSVIAGACPRSLTRVKLPHGADPHPTSFLLFPCGRLTNTSMSSIRSACIIGSLSTVMVCMPLSSNAAATTAEELNGNVCSLLNRGWIGVSHSLLLVGYSPTSFGASHMLLLVGYFPTSFGRATCSSWWVTSPPSCSAFGNAAA